jgi:hypothetical protein
MFQIDSACAAPNHLESDAALSCIQNGYSTEMVQKAIHIFIDRNGTLSLFTSLTHAYRINLVY